MSCLMKFGGSSLQTAERLKKVADLIVEAVEHRAVRAVVCSAVGGVTDGLIQLAKKAEERDQAYLNSFQELVVMHHSLADDLLSGSNLESCQDYFSQTFMKLQDVLHGIFLVRELTARTLDFVMSFGERLSNYLIHARLVELGVQAEFLDARTLVKTDAQFGVAHVLQDETECGILAYFSRTKALPIITGFLGSTLQQETTTLGRGGSDYTAALFGAVLEVQEIEIWTDVDGIMTADPGKVEGAFSLDRVSFEEAMEMSHFGAKVIYPPTMIPAMQKQIPLRIKNTLNPGFPGTVITGSDPTVSSGVDNQVPGHTISSLITGITSIDSIALLQLKGCGLIGVSGISARMFAALARRGINVVLISQASSEHAICVAISPDRVEDARKTIEDEFKFELSLGQVDPVFIEENHSIIAVVGENMRHCSGLAGIVFSALGAEDINIVAIAQGSSERNISFVVHQKDENKALNAVHRCFFPSKPDYTYLNTLPTGAPGNMPPQKMPMEIWLAGPGQVGTCLLEMLGKDGSLVVRSVISRGKRWSTQEHMGLHERCDSVSADPELFLRQLKESNANRVFVDCTAQSDWVGSYRELLEHGIPICTPNKKALTTDDTLFDFLINHDLFFCEANVGAGLPVLSTLKTLLKSGDRIRKIQAILSGTLSYLFNRFDGSQSFSLLVKDAHSKGLTEPHPADDLNGQDVARKILILGRMCGFEGDLSSVEIENLVDETDGHACSVPEFMKQLSEMDKTFEERRAKAVPGKLRYLAEYDGDGCRASLSAVRPGHPAYHLEGTDNLIAFYTDRYHQTPLVIRGAGAGLEVTAAQVFAEIKEAHKVINNSGEQRVM